MRLGLRAWVPLLRGGVAFVFGMLFVGCSTELPALDQSRTERGTLGEEVFKLVCRRVAGTEIPNDIDGSESSAVCLGNARVREQALAPDAGVSSMPDRLRALAELRPEIVAAVDSTLPTRQNAAGETERLANELEEFLRELVHFYDPPEERIQRATRSIARGIETLLYQGDGKPNAAALRGVARLAQGGMVEPQHSMGLYRALLGSAQLAGVFNKVLPKLVEDEDIAAATRTVLAGLALELADLEVDDDPESSERLTRDLALRSHPDFGGGSRIWVAERDERGYPRVVSGKRMPEPFMDEDADGLPDVEGGLLAGRAGADVPSPFPRYGERPTSRDARGRALNEDGEPLYSYVDADTSLLRAAVSEIGALFDPDTQIAVNLAHTAPAVFGERRPTQHRVGAAVLEGYNAPDTDQSPLIDLVDASNALTARPVFDRMLDMTGRLLSDHEAELVDVLQGLLAFENAVRPAAPRYPKAGLREGSTFWDDVFFELEKLSRRRGHGDQTQLQSLMYGALGEFPDGRDASTVQRMQGALVSVLLRYKDEWRGDPRDPEAPALGGFQQPVDRDSPDSAVTCGRDGCAGLLADSPYFNFPAFQTARNQKCVVQRPGQIGTDCGAPANQSLMQRSANLILEMNERAVCNRGISIADLLAFAAPVCEGKADRVAPFGEPDGDLYDPPRGDDPCEVYGISTSSEECRLLRDNERQTCRQLKAERDADQAELVKSSEDALAEPAAMAKYVRPFETGPDAVPLADGKLFPVRECELFDFPDVGRVFGQALTQDFFLKIPHPGLQRYLEDVARVVRPETVFCEDLAVDWTNPPLNEPDCVPRAAELSRSVFEDISDEVDTLDELIEFLARVKGMTTRPTSQAMTRVLFAAPGVSSLQVFDPLMVKGAPPLCLAPDGSDLRDAGAEACPADDTAEPVEGCCVADALSPPLRYRVDTYYGNTAFVWDVPFEVQDAKTGQTHTLTFSDTLVPISAAVNAHDYDPEADADRVDEFEDTGYLLSSIGAALGRHWDSADNPVAQDQDPSAPHYRPLSGLVTWEEMFADLLDDGSIVSARLAVLGDGVDDPATPEDERFIEGPLPDQAPDHQLGVLAEAYDLLRVLRDLDFGASGNGIDVSADLAENLLNPHVACARSPKERGVVAGRGACHETVSGSQPSLKPVTYRDGRDYVCYNDGTCFDGKDNYRFVSPMVLTVDALHALEDRIGEDPNVDDAFQHVRNGLIDHYLALDDRQLADRRLRGLALVIVQFMRDRWAYHEGAGDLRAWAGELTQDAVDLVEHPVFAGALRVLDEMLDDDAALDTLNLFAFELLREDDTPGFRALVAALMDLVQMLPGDEATVELYRSLASIFAPDVASVVERGGRVEVDDGAAWRNLSLTAEAAALDTQGVLAEVMQNLLLPALPGEERVHALDLFLEAALEVNRVQPGSRRLLDRHDWQAVLEALVDLLRDDRRGIERLFSLVQCRDAAADDESCR